MRSRFEHLPAYLALREANELEQRARQAAERLQACDLCPWQCRIDRRRAQLGRCRTGSRARVASYGPHFGEEAPLVGRGGSGTIFFARCNLKCLFCQNHEISQADEGPEVDAEQLAAIMLRLQSMGCSNINLVSPSHVIAPILQALVIAVDQGLRLPIVYNTGGYDSVDALHLLDGVVDIYLPDMKFADPEIARRLSGPPDYPAVNRAAVREMHRQVGDLQIGEDGLARRGLLVRHLVLPNGLAGTPDIARFLASEISPDTYINVMAQYHPCYCARMDPSLSRPITRGEYLEAVRAVRAAGLHRLDQPAPED